MNCGSLCVERVSLFYFGNPVEQELASIALNSCEQIERCYAMYSTLLVRHVLNILLYSYLTAQSVADRVNRYTTLSSASDVQEMVQSSLAAAQEGLETSDDFVRARLQELRPDLGEGSSASPSAAPPAR